MPFDMAKGPSPADRGGILPCGVRTFLPPQSRRATGCRESSNIQRTVYSLAQWGSQYKMRVQYPHWTRVMSRRASCRVEGVRFMWQPPHAFVSMRTIA